jgi:GTP-binding protein HflX
VRALELPRGTKILLSDTVGFITDLPTELIAAFRATLEEVREADLLIHVIDASDPDRDGRIGDVEGVLDEIEAGPDHDQRMIEAWNKIDRLDADTADEVTIKLEIANTKVGLPVKLAISAVECTGLEALLEAIETTLAADSEILQLCLAPHQAKALAWLHQHGEVVGDTMNGETGETTMRVRLSPSDAGRFRALFPELASFLPPLETEDY